MIQKTGLTDIQVHMILLHGLVEVPLRMVPN